MELLLVLGIPFAGGIVLALWGHRTFAPELNSTMSLATFAAAAALTARIITGGPMLVWDENFFVDPFNVFLVALTAFVAWLATREQPPRSLVRTLIAGNAAWVAASLALLFALAPTGLGIAFVVTQALAVVALTDFEWLGLRRLSR